MWQRMCWHLHEVVASAANKVVPQNINSVLVPRITGSKDFFISRFQGGMQHDNARQTMATLKLGFSASSARAETANTDSTMAAARIRLINFFIT